MNTLEITITIGFIIVIALVGRITDQLKTVNHNLKYIQDILKLRR
jgi:hypothetical protein